MKNSEIEKICLDIYREHKEALDLIYNNINIDDTYQIYEEIVSSLEKKQSECKDIIFDRQYSTKTHIRFRTKAMEKMFPKLENTVSYWNFPYDAFYEIINKRHNICIKFVVSASATYTQEDYTKLENKFKKIRKRKTSFGDKWKWKGTKKYTVKDMENKPIEEILDELKKKINHLIKEDDKIFK
ncbi:MAG: hypothetical protein HFJ35_00490 [Clostridia bacterium]|nr:hypothetical protein [Clostridia bacterium]